MLALLSANSDYVVLYWLRPELTNNDSFVFESIFSRKKINSVAAVTRFFSTQFMRE